MQPIAPVCLLAAVLAAGSAAAQQAAEASHAPREVVLCTSLGEAGVRSAVAPFESRTGIAVKVVRTQRRIGTTAEQLVRQIAAAKGDVWWCQEPLTTDALKRAGALERLQPPPAGADRIAPQFHDADGTWYGFAARARILMVNTERVPEAERPRSMWDLVDPKWRGKVVLCKPSGGTALFHLLALQHALGAAALECWLEGLRQNDCIVASSDTRLAEMIGAGEALVGMTDTSDYRLVKLKGQPVEAIWPDQDRHGTLLIPHTIARLEFGANAAAARALLEHLLSGEAEQILAAADRGQIPLRQGIAHPPEAKTPAEVEVMRVDLSAAAGLMSDLGARLQQRYAGPPAAGRGVDRVTTTTVVTFDDMAPGQPPMGMTVAQSAGTVMSVWTVGDDKTSPGGGRVLTQTDTDQGARYPLCIYDGINAKDVAVGACYKTMTGDVDRAAGLIVRYLDADNYYCCRVNSLEDNYRFYKVVDGRRIELASADHVVIMEDIWQTMRLEAQGRHFRMWMNGALVLECDDDTFPGPGKVGLWLKADSITSFDEFVISPPGTHRASDFEGEQQGAEPKGYRPQGNGEDTAPWRIVAAAPGGKGSKAVTPDQPPNAPAGSGPRRGGSMLFDAELRASDVSVFTRFKVATTGPGMHLAGLVARWRDADNHYHLRINPAESNLRLYRVADGKRTLIGERHHCKHDEQLWHTAQMTVTGTRIEVLIDGELQFAARDTVLTKAGKAGVWAVPGGNTHYDEIAVAAFQ
jgi:iron(III) transport system substrate-binding protein